MFSLYFSIYTLMSPPTSTLFPYTTLFRSDNDVSENQINSEIELLTSKDLLTQVVNETGLANYENGLFGGKPPENVRVENAVKDRKSTRLNSSHEWISYAVFCLKKKTNKKK